MKRALVFVLVALHLASASGCRSEAENLFRQAISDMHALADAMERNESPERIKAAAERLRATGERARVVKIEDAERARLKEKYSQQMAAAAKRLAEARAKMEEAAAAGRH